MANRASGKTKGVPHVPSKGGSQPRARREDGAWRKKRSDAGNTRKKSKWTNCLVLEGK